MIQPRVLIRDANVRSDDEWIAHVDSVMATKFDDADDRLIKYHNLWNDLVCEPQYTTVITGLIDRVKDAVSVADKDAWISCLVTMDDVAESNTRTIVHTRPEPDEYESTDGNCEHIKNGCYCVCPYADFHANDDGSRRPGRHVHPEGCLCACSCHPVCTCGDVYPDAGRQLAALIEYAESPSFSELMVPEQKALTKRIKSFKRSAKQ